MVPRPMYMAWDSTPGPGRPHDLGPITAGFFDPGPPFRRVLGRFAVSRRGPRRQENPGLAGAGSANPGFYAESGHYHSVNERTARGQPAKYGQSLNRTFSEDRDNPPRHPRFCARSQNWTGAGVSSHLFACGEEAKTRSGRLASPRRTVIRDGALSPLWRLAVQIAVSPMCPNYEDRRELPGSGESTRPERPRGRSKAARAEEQRVPRASLSATVLRAAPGTRIASSACSPGASGRPVTGTTRPRYRHHGKW
jgi:hypothetical protein